MAILFKLLLELLIVLSVLTLIRIVLVKTRLIFIVKKCWRGIQDWFHVYQLIKVPEFNSESTTQKNVLYNKLHVYLSRLESTEDSDFVNLLTGKKANDIIVGLEPNMVILDNFLGARVFWVNEHERIKEGKVRRCFVLKIRKSDKRRVLRPYLQHIHKISDEIEARRELRLHLNVSSNELNECRWKSIPFTHPSTFDTITMEEELKSKVKSDLDSFLKAKQYYHRLGRVWKRSFLLYGPSGTGKSSFVAAMANYMSFDVYDINLSRLKDDSDLKALLLQTTPRSIILIEDLDRFLNDNSKLSLSGIMNFMDGVLNSCCAEERVMIFTMNGKENVDPALLRPGRIDVHIHFQRCDFNSFRIMANSYLGVKDHKLFAQVEDVFHQGASLSPAEIGELMIMNRSSPSRAIKSVILALHTDGEGRGKWTDIALRKPREDFVEHEKVYCTEGVPAAKEFRKLYNMITRSNRKNHSGEMTL